MFEQNKSHAGTSGSPSHLGSYLTIPPGRGHWLHRLNDTRVRCCTLRWGPPRGVIVGGAHRTEALCVSQKERRGTPAHEQQRIER